MSVNLHLQKSLGPLTFGLDIGIASVGWAVLGENRIIDLGVRCFDKAETAKEGDSLNLVRRMARLMRRRLHRRAWRLTKLARLLKREGMIVDANLFKRKIEKNTPAPKSSWQLRVDALDHQLNAEEWADPAGINTNRWWSYPCKCSLHSCSRRRCVGGRQYRI